jgi:hypothetical protein
MWIAWGWSVKVVSDLIGHASIAMYGHLYPPAPDDAAAAFAAYLDRSDKPAGSTLPTAGGGTAPLRSHQRGSGGMYFSGGPGSSLSPPAAGWTRWHTTTVDGVEGGVHAAGAAA